MSDDLPPMFTEARDVRDDIKDVEHDGNCPKCQTELEMGYGLAGGGCGVYWFCPKCQVIVSKTEDSDE